MGVSVVESLVGGVSVGQRAAYSDQELDAKFREK